MLPNSAAVRVKSVSVKNRGILNKFTPFPEKPIGKLSRIAN